MMNQHVELDACLQWEAASAKDHERCAELILSSGPTAFHWVFSHHHGPSALIFLKNCFQQKNNQFSYRYHKVIKQSNAVLGCIALYDTASLNDCFLGTARVIFKHYGLRGIIKGLRFEYKLAHPPKKHCLYLAHIAVIEDARGKGLATRLIQLAYRHAQQEGHTALSLDVAANNHGARRLYSNLGFREVRFNKSFNTILDDHIYMEKPVSPINRAAD